MSSVSGRLQEKWDVEKIIDNIISFTWTTVHYDIQKLVYLVNKWQISERRSWRYKIISLASKLPGSCIVIPEIAILSVKVSVSDPSPHLFCDVFRPNKILSTNCGVLIVDQICLDILNPHQFPDVILLNLWCIKQFTIPSPGRLVSHHKEAKLTKLRWHRNEEYGLFKLCHQLHISQGMQWL